MQVNEAVWEFPSKHIIKVMALAQVDVESIVIDILKELQIKHNNKEFEHKFSSSNKYISLSVPVEFENIEQVKGIYASLKAHDQIVHAL